METDIISQLVEEAHEIFNATSIYEVIDLDRCAAIEVLNKIYDNPHREFIDRYWEILERLRWVTLQDSIVNDHMHYGVEHTSRLQRLDMETSTSFGVQTGLEIQEQS